MENTQQQDSTMLTTTIAQEVDRVITQYKHVEHSIEFKLERYKYILREIHTLNENMHKYLNLFQALATVVIGGGVGLFAAWRGLNITAEIVQTGIRGLLGLLIILTLFAAVSLFAAFWSWFDYRREEVALLNEMVGPGFRNPPRLSNFWRWQETYLVAFLIIIVSGVYWYVEYRVIPLIV
ncbi:MAG: hypothetical protein GFH27_549313n145 [Chloroflexi bacterium AL-W]|nr:hypothetical protein [Chloroflexi bacterium AL-N1]NOK69568.1 hypothetical protein [Chloroflexi bacterium AL-N10]NOK77533.1 hypothetical protein [Chloroflexi bacterium AL-N5]NOK84384.1 hypothetical protein [Chloroflexi bacterium AL-W]NOK91450.1 hypothetical protein [Chloroflexi bacterium AL-N15]